MQSDDTTPGPAPAAGRASDLVPPRLQPMMDRLERAVRADERIRVAWVGGSIARGIADDWSDIDLHLLVEDAEHFDVFAWFGTVAPTVLADTVPGVPGVFLFLDADFVHVDVVRHDVEGFEQEQLPARVLLDREDGAMVRDRRVPEPGGDPYYPADQVLLVLYFMGNAVTVVRRAEWLVLAHGTALLRDQFLVPLMLAENGVRKSDGAKRLNRYLTDEQRGVIAGLPAVGVDPDGLAAAHRAVLGEYLARARRLAEACDEVWPTALEEAGRRLWWDELGWRV